MTPVWLALAIVALFGIASWLTVWSRRDTWARPAAVVLFLVAIPVIGGALAESLGRAKPMSIAWEIDSDREYLALGARMVQDVGIWIWLDTGDPEPRSYRIPWSNEMANAIQKAMDMAPDGMEGQFIVNMDGTPDGEMTAHPLPQPASPEPKTPPEPGLHYEQHD